MNLMSFARTNGLLTALVVGFVVTGVAIAASHTLFGDAEIVQPGHNSPNAVQLRSDDNPGFGGIDLDVEEGLTFADLTELSTDYNVTDDDCAAGSPRFQINVQTDDGVKNIFAYIGPEPSYTGCTPNTWTTSGDLLETGKFVDTSQLGGTFYDPYDTAVITYGDLEVVGVQLVVDSGFAFPDGEQTILADNVMLNNEVHTFDDKESCKKGGWQSFTSDPGPFKNQGQCVSHFARQK